MNRQNHAQPANKAPRDGRRWHTPGWEWGSSALLTLAGVCSLPSLLVREGDGLTYSNSLLPVLLFALALPVIRRVLYEERALSRGKQPGWALFAGLCLSVALSLGSRLEADGYVDLKEAALWLCLLPAALFFAVLIAGLWGWLERQPSRRAAEAVAAGEEENAVSSPDGGSGVGERTATTAAKSSLPSRMRSLFADARIRRLALVLFFCLVWGITLAAVYPGFFVYDAQEEFNEVALREFTTHHPLLHVLLLGGTICAGNKLFGSYNAGIALYMVLQMLFMAVCFTYVLEYLGQKKAPGWLKGVSILYFAFFPVIQMYVLCSAKDTLYSAGMLLVIVLLLRLGSEGVTRRICIPLAAAMCFMALMRHNGLYVLLIMIPVLCLMAKRGQRRAALVTGLAAFLAYEILTGGMETVLSADDTENQELLTVPIQQLARVYSLDPDTYTQEELEVLFTYLPEEALSGYTPKCSDRVKAYFDNEAYNADASSFWRLWLSVGKKAPGVYLNAWLMTSYGFWYPSAMIDVYEGNTMFTFTYAESSYFGYETELPGVRDSRIPWLDRFYRALSLEVTQQRIPVVSMLFSPGGMFWLYAVGVLYLLKRRRIRTAAALLPVGLNWLTVLLGPTYLVRYVLIFWFALPILLLVVTGGEECYNDTNVSK